MAYSHEVFISYRRTGTVPDWVHEYFGPELARRVADVLPGQSSSVFFDKEGIRTGDIWDAALIRAMLASRCIVPVWSPSYFSSVWCVSEWVSFRDRGRMVLPGLVLPVRFQNDQDESLPRAAARVEYLDFSEYAIVGPAFRNHPDFVGFQRLVQRLAKDIARAIRAAPDYDARARVIVPEARSEFADYNVSLLTEYADYADVFVPPRDIGRPSLKAA